MGSVIVSCRQNQLLFSQSHATSYELTKYWPREWKPCIWQKRYENIARLVNLLLRIWLINRLNLSFMHNFIKCGQLQTINTVQRFHFLVFF